MIEEPDYLPEPVVAWASTLEALLPPALRQPPEKSKPREPGKRIPAVKQPLEPIGYMGADTLCFAV